MKVVVKSYEECLKIAGKPVSQRVRLMLKLAANEEADSYYPLNDMYKVGQVLIGSKYCNFIDEDCDIVNQENA